MFSISALARQLTKILLGLVLASVVLLPSTLGATVQIAKSQAGGMLGTQTGKTTDNSPADKSNQTPQESVGESSMNSPGVATVTALRPEEWKSWPVIPTLSPKALAIYQRGVLMGNNPQAFSKVGDGEISATWFLSDFDLGSDYYDLGTNTDLQATILHFEGSFGRASQAARRGFNAQRLLDLTLADRGFCQFNETPLHCEIRLHRPSFALISMGTNQVWQADQFESGLRTIIEELIAQGVVPVLSTKADNLEGDDRINLIVARLSSEYDLPLWNFWLAVQPLPNHGLQDDLEHLTYYPNDFGSQTALQFAWPVRNLSALQVLEMLMNETQP